jgi:hypothetical protein
MRCNNWAKAYHLGMKAYLTFEAHEEQKPPTPWQQLLPTTFQLSRCSEKYRRQDRLQPTQLFKNIKIYFAISTCFGTNFESDLP